MAITTTKTKTYLTTPTQGENLRFFLTLKFYVKSIGQKLQKSQKSKLKASKMVQNGII